MESIESRYEVAKTLWSQGEQAEAKKEHQLAYTLYTQAHDLIMDCAKLHQQSHVYLRRINWKIGNYGELITDWLLHIFAPLGVFELVSYLAKTDAFGAAICKRSS